jgi:capsular polysaccharide biosynthesis protein
MANQKDFTKYDFASTDLLIYIWEKRIPLAIISGLAAILSLVVSFTITPLFKSTVIMFPTTNASVSKNLLADNYGGKTTIYEIGEEEQAEQLLQVLNSEEIKNMIIKKYNLMEHYGIDVNSSFPNTQLDAAYRSNMRFKRTEFMSVQVDVMDGDPQMAADIANDISAFTDTVYNLTLKQRSVEAFHLVEKEYLEMLANVTMIKDSMDFLRGKGINNYNSQSDRYHEAYGKAIVAGNVQAIKTLQNRLDTISKYGGTYDLLGTQLGIQMGVFVRLKQRYLEAKLEADNNLPHIFVVDKAIKAEKKAYPKKSLIIIVSTLSAFLFGLLILIVSDNLKKKLQ